MDLLSPHGKSEKKNTWRKREMGPSHWEHEKCFQKNMGTGTFKKKKQNGFLLRGPTTAVIRRAADCLISKENQRRRGRVLVGVFYRVGLGGHTEGGKENRRWRLKEKRAARRRETDGEAKG